MLSRFDKDRLLFKSAMCILQNIKDNDMESLFRISNFIKPLFTIKDALHFRVNEIMGRKLSGKTIVILGNGFDLDLGLPTSYNQFVDSAVFKKHMRLEPSGTRVEYANGVCRDYGLMRYVQDSRQRDNWVDLELLLANYALRIRCTIQSGNNVISKMNENIPDAKIMYHSLVNALSVYLKSITYDSINMDSGASRLLKDISEFANIEIWTFNYTNLSRLCPYLGMNQIRCKVSHVHGSLENNDIILGFHNDAEVDNSFGYMKKMENPSHHFFGYGSKLNEADNVIFFGHSLGETDKDYFQGWLNGLAEGSVKSTQKILIYTKDNKSILQINMRINAMTGNRLNDIKSRYALSLYTSDVL